MNTMNARRAGWIAAALTASMPALAAGCPWPATFVAASARPTPAARFATVDRAMPIAAIVAALGPAARDVGSGVHVLEWDVDDGRVFRVSVADACSRPVALGVGRPLKAAPARGQTP